MDHVWTIYTHAQMDVEPKIGVLKPPKWMVKIMEKPIKMDNLGVPFFWKHPDATALSQSQFQSQIKEQF